MDQQIKAPCVLMVKKGLRQKVKLSIFWSTYVPALTYGRELWIIMKRTRTRIQATEMRFLSKVAGPSLRDKVRTWSPGGA